MPQGSLIGANCRVSARGLDFNGGCTTLNFLLFIKNWTANDVGARLGVPLLNPRESAVAINTNHR